jgi:hypothetical protein
MTRVAIMQPYFFPYAGYFRLFAACDLFVVLDNVQFPRRGWVHRNRLRRQDGELDWMTLPLAPAPQSVQIRDLAFRDGIDDWGPAQLRRFPALKRAVGPAADLVAQTLAPAGAAPLDYLTAGLAATIRLLGLERPMIAASSLSVPPGLQAEDLILALARAAGADVYVNLAGGTGLYDPAAFAAAGIELRFLPDYRGNYASILERLILEEISDIAADIIAQSQTG